MFFETEKYNNTIVITDLNYPAVERFDVYGEPYLFNLSLYNQDIHNVGITNPYNGQNVYYYVLPENIEFSVNQKVYSGGTIVYSLMTESFKAKLPEPEGQEGEVFVNPNDYKNTDWVEIPKHPWEQLNTERVIDDVIRYNHDTFKCDLIYNLLPYTDDALTFMYVVPDDQIYTGYNDPEVFETMEDYLEAKNDDSFKEGLLDNSTKDVYYIKETKEYYFLSYNGETLLEKKLNYSIPTITRTYANSPLGTIDGREASLWSRVGTPIYTVNTYPTSIGTVYSPPQFYLGRKFYNYPSGYYDRINDNVSFKFTLRGYQKMRTRMRYQGTSWWSNYYDDGRITDFRESTTFMTGHNFVSSLTYNVIKVNNVLPQYVNRSFIVRGL